MFLKKKCNRNIRIYIKYIAKFIQQEMNGLKCDIDYVVNN